MYLRLPDHVRGHFLICFLALCVHRYLEYKLRANNTPATTDGIIRGLNRATISLINPTSGIEFYGTAGFDSTVQNIMNLVGLTPPNTYEEPSALRKKMRLYTSVRDLFSSTTTSLEN